jgi:hypothetical protein
MKTTHVLSASLLAAAALAALLLNPVASCAGFALAGVLVIFAGDYRTERRPVGAAA